MSNETMPEKIWVRLRPVPLGNGNKENYIEICSHDKLGSIPYTRTDTIPSRAQVARSLMDEAASRVARWTGDFAEMLQEVVEEWEAEEGVKKLPTLADMVGCVNVPDGVEYVREGRDAETV